MSIGHLKLSELHLAGIIWLAGPEYRRQLKLILANRPAKEVNADGDGELLCSCGRPDCIHRRELLRLLEARPETQEAEFHHVLCECADCLQDEDEAGGLPWSELVRYYG